MVTLHNVMAAMLGRITQQNMLLVPLSDPAGVGGCHCQPHPERLLANQGLSSGT